MRAFFWHENIESVKPRLKKKIKNLVLLSHDPNPYLKTHERLGFSKEKSKSQHISKQASVPVSPASLFILPVWSSYVWMLPASDLTSCESCLSVYLVCEVPPICGCCPYLTGLPMSPGCLFIWSVRFLLHVDAART
jgi:hypothetical protein